MISIQQAYLNHRVGLFFRSSHINAFKTLQTTESQLQVEVKGVAMLMTDFITRKGKGVGEGKVSGNYRLCIGLTLSRK